MESLANELAPAAEPDLHRKVVEDAKQAPIETNGHPWIPTVTNGKAIVDIPPELLQSIAAELPMEFAGLTQKDAIIKALRTYGPQNASQLYDRLTCGGMPGLKRQQLAVSICNTKRKRGLLRDEDGKYRILDVLTK